MKRIGTPLFLAMLALVGLASMASAVSTPIPNGIYAPPSYLRWFNDYPQATVNLINNYPASIQWTFDCPFAATGWGEKGIWQLSGDGGASQLLFPNLCNYSYEGDFTLDGTNLAHAEGGLSMTPWWSQDAGEFMANTTGEITYWGGILPSFGFSATYGLTYVLGGTIHEKVVYMAGVTEPTAATPATEVLSIIWLGIPYSSGVLVCGPRNPSDPPLYHDYGQLDNTKLGGQALCGPIMPPVGTGAGNCVATWGNLNFQSLDALATPTKSTSWGSIKSLYR